MSLFGWFCFGVCWSWGGVSIFEKLEIHDMNGLTLSLTILLCGPIVWLAGINAWLNPGR